nr:hypothetical protein Iba_chr01bCG17280 [Ipomoea batatas]
MVDAATKVAEKIDSAIKSVSDIAPPPNPNIFSSTFPIHSLDYASPVMYVAMRNQSSDNTCHVRTNRVIPRVVLVHIYLSYINLNCVSNFLLITSNFTSLMLSFQHVLLLSLAGLSIRVYSIKIKVGFKD